MLLFAPRMVHGILACRPGKHHSPTYAHDRRHALTCASSFAVYVHLQPRGAKCGLAMALKGSPQQML